MSRTDKTKPWRVRVAEHNPLAVHDHRDGICDLPEDPRDNKWRGCHWADDNLTHSSCCWGCGCPTCTDQGARKAKRKKERAEARRLAHREIHWGDERYGIERYRSARKNTWAWCKGQVGRKHQHEVRWSSWGNYALVMGKTCFEQKGGWRGGWHCYHEIGCKVCGKITTPVAPQDQCPIWRAQK